ncbi:MAG: Nif3-like dinuclear metal center hexameric protein [Verrucomicrobiota bacterium]
MNASITLAALAESIDAWFGVDEPTCLVQPRAKPVRRLGLALDPWPGLSNWAAELALDAVFLHRHWRLDPRNCPGHIGVLANHAGFDVRLGFGENPELLTALGLRMESRLGESRALGVVATGAPRTINMLRESLFGIFGGVEEELLPEAGQAQRLIQRIALARAMRPGLIENARAAGAQAYVTGQLRQPARASALATGMTVFAVGHRRSEQWALKQLGMLLARRWPALELYIASDTANA